MCINQEKMLRMYREIVFVSLSLIIICPAISSAAVFHVKVGGLKSSGASVSGDWGNSNCYATIGAAIKSMQGGDEVIVDDGKYEGVQNSIANVPSGTAENYSIIRARNPFAATIDSGISGDWNYYGRMVSIGPDDAYIQVDAFRGINRDGSNNRFIEITGHHVKITRCQIRTEGPDNRENSVLLIGGDASYVLVEDCAMTGGYRYGFLVVGIGSAPHHIVFRRCVGRADWSDSDEPISMFAVYGHNSSAALGPHDIYYQNCIAIDQNASVPDADWKPYGPWYVFKGNSRVTLDGCITLNNDQTGSTSGSWLTNTYGGSGVYVKNSVFWGFKGIGLTLSGDDVQVSSSTFGGNSQGGFRLNASSGESSVINCLFYDNTGGAIVRNSPGVALNNSFYKDSLLGSNVITFQDDLKYLLRVEEDSNRYAGGNNGGHVGAHIINKLGKTGTLWGENGWNQEQPESLWPWPYEDYIWEWFRVPNVPPSGATPAVNNTKRGFAADGQTLTNYIWGYLGNGVPDEFGSAPLTIPASLSIPILNKVEVRD
jgi:hypothetical protein